VGATKLERYGATFLAVITGAEPAPMHPMRRKMAGRDAGALFDELQQVQMRLARGPDGIDKPLSCTNTTLKWIAERRPDTLDDLERAPGMGAQKAERFGPAFLDVLRTG
jgi:ATP-dependent DNA helicase RecQ